MGGRGIVCIGYVLYPGTRGIDGHVPCPYLWRLRNLGNGFVAGTAGDEYHTQYCQCVENKGFVHKLCYY